MANNKNTWLITAERFIAYFDIMGFKSMIKTGKLPDLYNKFMTLIKTNIKGNRRSRITYYIYSDLIVVVTQDSSQDSLKQLLEASVKITNQILNLDWGVSGSIAKGKLVFDKHNQIFLGQPVVDAYLAQEDVEFYGIVICDSAVDDVKKYGNYIPLYSKSSLNLFQGTFIFYNELLNLLIIFIIFISLKQIRYGKIDKRTRTRYL